MKGVFEVGDGIEYTKCEYKGCKTMLFSVESDDMWCGPYDFKSYLHCGCSLNVSFLCSEHKHLHTCKKCGMTKKLLREIYNKKRKAEKLEEERKTKAIEENKQLKVKVAKLEKQLKERE